MSVVKPTSLDLSGAGRTATRCCAAKPRRPASRSQALSAVLAVGLWMVGCVETPPPVEPMDAGAPVDAGPVPVDAPPRPDGATLCATDAECDDGIECTRDSCDATAGYCRNAVDPATCDDGLFCNGAERCDTRRGCVPGPRETCDDGQVCTVDRCNEEMKTCEHSERDLDEDGDPDFFCPGGADCDDRDPGRNSTAPEICGDMTDNDCDSTVDESECGRPPHDACDDPLDISAGGLFVVDTTGSTADYVLGCVGAARQDVVLTFTLTEPRDVAIEADASFFTTVLALRTACEDRTSELECRNGFPGRLRRRALPAGTYFVVVTGYGVGEIGVTARFDPATGPASNESCVAPIDVSEGGVFRGTFVDAADDVTTACGFGGSPDLVYSFTTTSERDVRVTAAAADGSALAWEIRSTCTPPAGRARCSYGSPAAAQHHQLPAGTYFLVVEGPGSAETDFTLDVAFLDPAPAPAGDLCDRAIPLTLGTPTAGTLADKQDDLELSCGYRYRDAMYSFTIAERSDVLIDLNAGSTFMNASLRTGCAEPATQLRCESGGPLRSRVRDLAAGTYFVIVESSRAAAFTLTVTASAPVPVVPVSGNETCASAYVVPATGGIFSGSTTTMLADYTTASCGAMAQSNDAVFRLDLTARRRVVATTDGSTFDTVLALHSATCRSGSEIACDDDGGSGSASLLDRVLEPGMHFFVVDGFGMGNAGSYVFEVQVTDP